MTIKVLVTEIANAKNRLSKNGKPRMFCPTTYPATNVPDASERAIRKTFLSIFLSFSIGNSVPTTNKRSTIPISANKFRIY